MCIGLHIDPHTGLTARIGPPRNFVAPLGIFVVCRALGGQPSVMPHSFLCCHVRSVCCGVLCLVEVLAVAHAYISGGVLAPVLLSLRSRTLCVGCVGSFG